MSNSKKKQSISDKINDVLKPKTLHGEEIDDNEARFEEFTEQYDLDNQLSDIRKRNTRNLSELDNKYKGAVVSRKELDLEDSDSSDDKEGSDEESANDENYATDSDEEEDLDNSGEGDQSDDLKESSEGSDDDDDPEDDYDISQSTRAQLQASTSNDSNTILKKVSVDEEIKKGVSVQNQLKVWEKLLEIRIKSQKMLITANSLPDYNAHLELSTLEDQTFTEKMEEACDGVNGLLDNLVELQNVLVNQ